VKRSALIVTSVRHCTTAQETLRVQDTVAALRRNGWAVDVLTPTASPILAATLAHDVRVFTVPKFLPCRKLAMFLRGVALASGRDYRILHGLDEGAGIVRAIDRFTFKRLAYIAEVHHPESVGRETVAHASAVIVPDEETLSRFVTPPPLARVSVLPDPHAELADNAFTAAEYSDALDGIYTYVLRIHPEIDQ
jgi:hypothetical protein